MVVQIHSLMEEEGKDFELISKRFNDNKVIKALR